MTVDRRVLLHVEDDSDDALLIGRALTLAGVEAPVRVVEDGEEAVQYLEGCAPFAKQAEHSLPGLILLDLNTPRLNGHEFLQWLREKPRLRRIPVVVLTSSSAERDVVSAYEAGANAFLVKPLGHREMTEMLRDMAEFWFHWNHTGSPLH